MEPPLSPSGFLLSSCLDSKTAVTTVIFVTVNLREVVISASFALSSLSLYPSFSVTVTVSSVLYAAVLGLEILAIGMSCKVVDDWDCEAKIFRVVGAYL